MLKKPAKYYLLTFGCQMNKSDSERIVSLLESLGLKSTDKPERADLLLINTCSVRQASEDRVYGFINNWQKLRQKKTNLIIGVTGCMPGRDKDKKLKNKIKGVDLFFPIDELPLLPVWLRQLNSDLFKFKKENNLEDYLSIEPLRTQKHSAFVSIQTGCNNFCSYCVVPNSRGRERNRPLKDILKEIKLIAKKGCKEVVLLGQVVNNYRMENIEYRILNKKNPFNPYPTFDSQPNPYPTSPLAGGGDHFAALLWEVNQIKGIERIHFTAADPQYFNDYQIQALTLPKMVNYLHLPVQSGSDTVLKRMNRKYTKKYYLDLIKKIKIAKPDIALGTDIIVGYCGETKKEFLATVGLYKKANFDIAYLAMYSQRSGTLAAKMYKDDIPKTEKKRRWQILQDLMEETTYKKNHKYIGQVLPVLVKNYENGFCSGESNELKLVRFAGKKSLVGKIVRVTVTKAEEWILWGEMI